MKNWTIKEAVKVIENGTDAEAIKEIARINPVFAIAVAKHDVVTIADMMGEKFTVRRLDAVGTSEDVEDTEDEAVEAEAPVKATKKTAKAKAPVEVSEDGDLASMSTKQLMALCDKKGIKVPHYGKNKAFYLEKLQGSAEEPADEDEAEKDGNPYAGLKTTQLFKMCKEQGIKAEMRKPAKYYIDLLEAAKAENVEAEADAEDDWDEEEEAPAKPAKKAPAKKAATSKKAKKPAPMPEPEDDGEAEDEDDGDEWDI